MRQEQVRGRLFIRLKLIDSQVDGPVKPFERAAE